MRAKKKLTPEAVDLLRGNPYTEKVTGDQISFTLAFKEAFWRLSVEGCTGNMAFRQLGYDPEVLGFERVRNITKRIRHAACTPEGIQSAKKSRMRISKEHFSQAESEKMSRRGNCRDIAPQESFFGHMTDELAGAIKKWTSFEDVKRAIDDWIDYYSNDRYQWDLAKLSPNECYRYLTTGEYPF